jgi:hypothetical protein
MVVETEEQLAEKKAKLDAQIAELTAESGGESQ